MHQYGLRDRAERGAPDVQYAQRELLDGWLAGVQTLDGKDGLPAVKAHLGL